jgi:hypothetical protein
VKHLLTPEVWSWLVALAAAAYAYFGLVQQVVPTFGARNAGGEGDEDNGLRVTGPAARGFGLAFALVIPLAFASHVLGMLALGAVLAAAWFKAK